MASGGITGWHMRNFLKYLILAPIAVLFLSFDMANRQNVIVSFDPFNSAEAASPQIVLPLFVVLIAATMLGVVLGGFATWLSQGRFRKAARQARAKAEELRGENDFLRQQLAEVKSSGAKASNILIPARGDA